MYRSRAFAGVLAVVVSVVTVGCDNKPPAAVDLVQTGAIKAEGSSDPMVVVSPPRLVRYDIALEIKGSVTRQPGVDDPIPGRLEALLISPAGTVIHRLPLSWTPFEIPVSGSRASSYLIRFIETPPNGSTVKVMHVNPPVSTQ